MSETIEAEVVQTANLAKAPAPAISYTLPTVTVGNMEAVESFVAQVEEFFDGCEIDPTDADQVKALKGLRADVNKAASSIDGKRKDMDRAVKGAMAEADGALNALRDRLKAVYAKTGAQIEEADRIWLHRRWGLLAEEYEGLAPDLIPLIDLGAFADAERRLVQKSTTDAKACALLGDMVARAIEERDALKGLNLPHAVEADKVYCETLSLKSAIGESERIEKAEAARREHAERMRELEESVAARRGEGVGPDDTGDPGMIEPQWNLATDEVREWTLKLRCAGDEMEMVVACAEGLGIECEVERWSR